MALIAARAQAIWSRVEPKHIPSAESILGNKGKAKKSNPNDLRDNARAWIVAIKGMNKGK